ncbi:MAG: DUF2115 domain-containing protein [Methanoregulaceae archaeon]
MCTTIRSECCELARVSSRADLGAALAGIVLRYSPSDIQQMKQNFSTTVKDMDPAYRDLLTAKITEYLLGTFQRVRLMQQQGAFSRFSDSLPESAATYWAMAGNACCKAADADGAHLRFLKYLLAGFCMFVLQEPAHPVGTPFPGGDSVELVDGIYYCPVREKSGDVDAAICPFCPAHQTPEIGYLKPPTNQSKNRRQEFIRDCYSHHHFNG